MSIGDKDRPSATRRGFLRMGLTAIRDAARDSAQGVIAESTGGVPPSRPVSAPPITPKNRPAAAAKFRPPGALPEPFFLDACTRCHACIEACPEGVIVPTPESAGPKRARTPMLRPNERPCYLCTSVPCAAACPGDALSLVAAHEIRIGIAVVAARLCINTGPESCDACTDQCPIEGPAITIPSGGANAPIIDGSHCTGCGLCVVVCPAYPAALSIVARVR